MASLLARKIKEFHSGKEFVKGNALPAAILTIEELSQANRAA
jgi:hypothetical protein